MPQVSSNSQIESGAVHPYNRLLWADCEFTGLDITQGHKIIEIGAIVTDLALREIDSYASFVGYDWGSVEALMSTNPWWDDRPSDKERMRRGLALASPVKTIDTELSAFVAKHFAPAKPPLCGNTISNDKKHIDDQLPQTSRLLSYRVVDVTSLKIVSKLYKNVEYTGKTHKHYALDDIRESLDEFRYLLKCLGIASLSDSATENT